MLPRRRAGVSPAIILTSALSSLLPAAVAAQSAAPPTAAFPDEPPTASAAPAASTEAPSSAPNNAAPPPTVVPPGACAPGPCPAPAPVAPSPPTRPPNNLLPAQPAVAPPPLVWQPPQPPPPPPQPPARTWPMLSLRSDPIELLFYGRLQFELESEILKWLSFELVPTFLATTNPPGERDDLKGVLTQHSDGWGPLTGGSVGFGFWLANKGLRGTVLRAIYANNALTYRSDVDRVSYTERELYFYFGSHSVWSGFTLAGGVGVGLELNRERRCFAADGSPVSDCHRDQLLIATSNSETANLHSWSYPLATMLRFSLGVTF